jgi:O-antigen/teichoic acid export membrane protein
MLRSLEAIVMYKIHTVFGDNKYMFNLGQRIKSLINSIGPVKSLIRLPLLYNATYLLGINLLPAVAGFFFWVFASKFYSSSDIGYASVIISSITFISWAAGLGTNIGLIRFIPETPDPHRLINTVLNLNIILSVVFGIIFLLGMPLWASNLQSALGPDVIRLVFIIFITASTLGTSIRDSFTAYRRSDFAFVFAFISSFLRVALIYWGIVFGTLGLVGSTAIAYIIAYLFSILFLMPRVSPGFIRGFRLNWPDLKKIFPISGSNYFFMLIMQMTQTIIPLMTLELLGSEQNAYSYIALMVGSLATAPGFALASSAFAEGANDIKHHRLILKKALYISMPITIISAVTLALCTPWVLSLFGIEYVQNSASLLRCIALSAPLIVINQIYLTYLRLNIRNGILVINSVILMTTTLVVAYFLLPAIGILANGIGILIGNLVITLFAFTFWIIKTNQND